ncbi:MAG: phosphopantothenoylcysteine decarboxylase [Candidatus Omnitrophica bacterium]|nr:phosphopantothenoylcysteine decarboxylase [Candidatus Omnitrophota bacterium]
MTAKGPRAKKVFLITAGPTVEPIDPVRYISNRSTGRMGYELALAAIKRNYKVILIHGPVSFKLHGAIMSIEVSTASEMRKRVLEHFSRADYVIMAAAVCDFRPARVSRRKIKKHGRKEYWLRLKQNSDILKELGARKERQVLVGYSLETEKPVENAMRKLRSKKLDFIVANVVGKRSNPFGDGPSNVLLLGKKGVLRRIKNARKRDIASQLSDFITGYKE